MPRSPTPTQPARPGCRELTRRLISTERGPFCGSVMSRAQGALRVARRPRSAWPASRDVVFADERLPTERDEAESGRSHVRPMSPPSNGWNRTALTGTENESVRKSIIRSVASSRWRPTITSEERPLLRRVVRRSALRSPLARSAASFALWPRIWRRSSRPHRRSAC